MSNLSRNLIATAAAASLVATALAQSTPSLTLGSTAPALKVAKWFKGKPVTRLGNGKVNVVEFWATWCGPCKVSIPHLTDMAKKYKGKATFTGVSVWESHEKWDNAIFTKIDKFVKDMGPKMDYNVAADGPEATMAKTWMAAAGQDGIPTAFVVDRKGKVVWIGHPMVGLDEAVGQVIAGTYDIKKSIAAEEERAKAAAAEQALMQPYMDALKKKDYPATVAAIDKIVEVKPELKLQLSYVKFNQLLKFDEPAAYALATEVSTGIGKDEPQLLNALAWQIVDDASKLKSPDYAVAVAVAERAAEASKNKDAMILDTLGYSYYKAGNIDKAIATQTKAVELVENDSKVDEKTKKEIKDRLATFKAKKG